MKISLEYNQELDLWTTEDYIPITNGEFIPKGYVTDLASIPRIFWSLYPPYGKYLRAAIVHDYLLDIDHKKAHEIFYDLMRLDGVDKFTAFVFYWFVKLFDDR